MDWQFRGADFRKFNILNDLEAFSDTYTIYIDIYIYIYIYTYTYTHIHICMYVCFFCYAAWLVGSQLPNQRLNLGHSSESPKP